MVNRGGVKVGDGVSVWQIYDQRPASVSERGGGKERKERAKVGRGMVMVKGRRLKSWVTVEYSVFLFLLNRPKCGEEKGKLDAANNVFLNKGDDRFSHRIVSLFTDASRRRLLFALDTPDLHSCAWTVYEPYVSLIQQCKIQRRIA